MRALGVRSAEVCETARTPKGTCRCRCKGNLHGAARPGDVRDLPRMDPHNPYRKHWEMEQLPLPIEEADKQRLKEVAAEDGLSNPFEEEESSRA